MLTADIGTARRKTAIKSSHNRGICACRSGVRAKDSCEGIVRRLTLPPTDTAESGSTTEVLPLPDGQRGWELWLARWVLPNRETRKDGH